jgi:hypothetical protein
MSNLLPLVIQLKSCPAQDDRITTKRLLETWDSFKQIAPDQGDTISSAMMAGLILYDPETFASLLTAAEQEQLITLGLIALERYQTRTNPPNKLGKLIAAAIKETI